MQKNKFYLNIFGKKTLVRVSSSHGCSPNVQTGQMENNFLGRDFWMTGYYLVSERFNINWKYAENGNDIIHDELPPIDKVKLKQEFEKRIKLNLSMYRWSLGNHKKRYKRDVRRINKEIKELSNWINTKQ